VFADQTSDFVGVSDAWGRVLYLNPAACKRLGVADATDLTVAEFFPAEAIALYYEEIRPQLLRSGSWSGVVPVNVAGGVAVPMFLSTTARLGPGGETNGNVVYAHELLAPDPGRVTDEAAVDEETGVLTRDAFGDRVRLALAEVHRNGEMCALVIAEVVDVSDAIDALGALNAARVMRSLAGRMKRVARTIDIVGRPSEHRLGLLLRGIRGRSEAMRIADAVYDALVDPPVTTAGGDAVVTVACGVAYSKAGDELVDLIERASAAMPHATAPNGIDIGALPFRDGTEASVTIEEFRVGISRGEVRPYAQPIVDLASGLLVGYRGLARWEHRRLGTLKAAAFVEMLAESPLAKQVDLLVARETAAVLALAARGRTLHMYTPVSQRLLADVRTEQYLSEIADAFFLSNNQIRLQLDGHLLRGWRPALRDSLQSLRDADIAVVLTGIGHLSEVPSLSEYQFEELHLSRQLTSIAATDANARHTVSEIAQFAHNNASLVAAVGVNDEHQRDTLVEAGCDLATGDLYGRPEPTDTID